MRYIATLGMLHEAGVPRNARRVRKKLVESRFGASEGVLFVKQVPRLEYVVAGGVDVEERGPKLSHPRLAVVESQHIAERVIE